MIEMKKYEISEENPSEIVFEVHGADAKELFVNAAHALFSVMCVIDDVEPSVESVVEVDADSLSDLLLNWLQALIAETDMEDMYFSKFELVDFGDNRLRAICSGEPVSLEKSGTQVKAASYRNFKFEKNKDGSYRCSISMIL